MFFVFETVLVYNLGWPQTCNLPTSAFCVLGLHVYHHTQFGSSLKHLLWSQEFGSLYPQSQELTDAPTLPWRGFLNSAWAAKLYNLGDCYFGSEGHSPCHGQLTEHAQMLKWPCSIHSLPLTFPVLDTQSHRKCEYSGARLSWMSVEIFYFHYIFFELLGDFPLH